jgi:hypothetical protein
MRKLNAMCKEGMASIRSKKPCLTTHFAQPSLDKCIVTKGSYLIELLHTSSGIK